MSWQRRILHLPFSDEDQISQPPKIELSSTLSHPKSSQQLRSALSLLNTVMSQMKVWYPALGIAEHHPLGNR